MAAEGLEKAAKAKGCFIKVETRGSGGAKNVLTAEEIKNADCIIVAADTKVPMDRFNGKKLIEVQVSDGISKADKLIEQAMSGNVPVYTASENAEVSEKKAGGSKGHQIYMQLMNGVSHMLPFVVGGGILIALAFLIDGLCVDMTSLTAEARQSFGSITPVAATLKSIGNLKKIVRKTSGSTGKNCSSPSLSGIRHSDRGTCYDVCRRASNRSIEHGTEHSSYKHEWFQ